MSVGLQLVLRTVTDMLTAAAVQLAVTMHVFSVNPSLCKTIIVWYSITTGITTICINLCRMWHTATMYMIFSLLSGLVT